MTTIGVEARSLLGEPTGVGRYLRNLLREMLQADESIRFRLYFDREGDDGLGDAPRLERRRLAGRGRNALVWTHAALPGLVRADAPPLMHFPFYTLPWSPPCPSVVTIHDITFTLHPSWFPWRSRIAFGAFARRSARRAAHVLTVSEASRRDLIDAYGLPPERVTAIPLAPDDSFSPRGERESAEVARRHGVESPYLLHLGSLHPRRNLPRLLDAMASLNAPVSLVLVGRCERPYTSIEPMIRARGLGAKVRHLGYVPETDLPALVSGAIALVYPSLYEGFGLPVIEAMACGTPVLTSSVSALPETAGGAALLVNPLSTEAIARGLSDLISSPGLRASLREKGLARARDFSWRRTALATLEVYRSALARAV